MTPFGRISRTSVTRRPAVFALIALSSWLIALLPSATAPTRAIVNSLDDFFYDTFYKLRPVESRLNDPVVILTVDQRSLDAVDKTYHYGWPWPRELWGIIATYLNNAGARVVAFDLLFTETSAYQTRTGDDDSFAAMVSKLNIPIIYASDASSAATWSRLAPPVKSPIFGAIDVNDDKIYRRYTPQVNANPSLATATLKAAGIAPNLPSDQPFLLHYYGPTSTKSHDGTYRYISAASVLAAQFALSQGQQPPASSGVTPDLFRGKIVLIGASATGTYDLKASPLSPEYPGVEVHATAIDNLINGQQVQPLSPPWQRLPPLVCAIIVSAGIIFPRRASIKAFWPLATIAALLVVAIFLFRTSEIRWLPPTSALLATAAASVAGFTFTFYAENRQRRFMLKALSKIVSPAVAQQLARDPARLVLGTLRTQLTVLFTDLENFTEISEGLDEQKLTEMLNCYLGAMSDEVLLNDGTLDKYIGDAIMCFWNAPLPQPDHAARGCRAALQILRREREMQAELRSYGAKDIRTRIGINTTPVAVGFIGSSHLFNYTALGDGVNLASRLEGANKLYGTQILLSESTANLVRDQFVLRKIDVLRVKGKQRPMAVYELIAELPLLKTPALPVREYELAFAHYQAKEWDDAQRILLELAQTFKEDGPTKMLLQRVEQMLIAPPPDDWDGVYVSKTK